MSGLHSHHIAMSQPPKCAACLSCRAPSRGQHLQQEEGCRVPFRRGKLSSHSISTPGAGSLWLTGAGSLWLTGVWSLRVTGALSPWLTAAVLRLGAVPSQSRTPGSRALPEPAAGADARCRAGVSPHAALVEAVILPRERSEVWGLPHRAGKAAPPGASPYLGVRLLGDLGAVGRVVSLGVVLSQQGPAGWGGGVSSDPVWGRARGDCDPPSWARQGGNEVLWAEA